MSEYHVAVDHPESPDPDSPVGITTTYLGVCDQDHVDEVRAIAALEDSPRFVLEHPHIDGAFTVLRDDGDLDVYVPVGAPEYRVYEPDPNPKTEIDGLGGSDLPRGAAGPAYISGVTRFGDQIIGGAMDYPSNPPRAVWHTTESPAGANYFTSIAAYLIRVGSEPQVIYDPVTDKLGQFGPLTQSARALQNDGARRTNREGKVCIQVEVLGKAASPWTKGFDPSSKPNYQRLIAAMRAHGIPDVWPAGAPLATAAAVAKKTRSKTTWQSKGGHFSHGQVPSNSHWDPGAIDTSIVPGKAVATETGGSSGGSSSSGSVYTVKQGDTLSAIAAKYGTTVDRLVALNGLKDPDDLAVGQKLRLPAKAPATPVYEPFPGANFFHPGRHSPIVTALGRRLVALGFGKHYSKAPGGGPGPNWTNADKANVRDFQLSRADLKGDADGIPGPKTWAALRVPKI
ncbi:peptidoglycan-binding protein [Streptomyces griseorubiginosus]|uniref:peptidoglycan-binding protein n=1 Tax=Streptomyces griseorubiginosus TaxID=67304 RepID=UPI00331C4E97